MPVEGSGPPGSPHSRHREGAPHRQHGLGPQVLEGGSAGLGRLSPLQLDEAGWLALLAPADSPPPFPRHSSSLALLFSMSLFTIGRVYVT